MHSTERCAVIEGELEITRGDMTAAFKRGRLFSTLEILQGT